MAEQRASNIAFIGKCNFRGNERVFGIKAEDRRQHMYVIGKTGTGKTTLLENLVLQDIRAGRGLGIIDPHGEFVERVLDQIPEDRIQDVVYLNPVDDEYPIGFNVLEAPDVRYKHLIVSNLLGIFTKIWANVWSARMEYILQNCILALIDTPGTTLLGVPRILVDKEYREKIVANVQDPVVRSFWVYEYETWREQFRNEAIVPIQNKVGQFLNTGFIRNIVGQAKSTLNIPEVMNSGKILLVNVSKGKIGEDNSALLGAMIITSVQLAAMERIRISEDERRDFYLYVDEFQNFATDSFASILSEARKYRLNLLIAHQYIGQLVTDVSTKVRDAVFGNVGTMITFRVGATDAEYLEKEFMPEFLQQDLIGLPNHNIYLKLMVDGLTSRPFSAVTLPPLKYSHHIAERDAVIDFSRKRYGNSREEVEREINLWSGATGGADGGSGPRGSSGVRAPARAGAPTMYEATCSNCGKATTVPFKPDGKRPVYCLQCWKQIEEGKLVSVSGGTPHEHPAHTGNVHSVGAPGHRGDESIGSEPVREEMRGSGEHRAPPRLPEYEKMPLEQEHPRPRNVGEGQQERTMPSRERRPERRPPERTFPSQPIVHMPSDNRKISLSQLQPGEKPLSSAEAEEKNEKYKPPRKEISASDLRHALRGFLKPQKDSSSDAPAPGAKDTSSGNIPRGQEGQNV